jgi:hypothetical protein
MANHCILCPPVTATTCAKLAIHNTFEKFGFVKNSSFGASPNIFQFLRAGLFPIKTLVTISESSPDLVPYAKSLFAKFRNIIFNDNKNKITLTVEQIVDIGTMVFSGVQRASVNQPSYTKTVMSRLDFQYFISGVNCTSVNDIPIIQELKIIDNGLFGKSYDVEKGFYLENKFLEIKCFHVDHYF